MVMSSQSKSSGNRCSVTDSWGVLDISLRDEVGGGSLFVRGTRIGINYAHAHRFPKCFKSLHTLLGFALCFMSSTLILVAVTIYSIVTCTRIPCRDSHCETGLLRCCLYIKSLGATLNRMICSATQHKGRPPCQ